MEEKWVYSNREVAETLNALSRRVSELEERQRKTATAVIDLNESLKALVNFVLES